MPFFSVKMGYFLTFILEFNLSPIKKLWHVIYRWIQNFKKIMNIKLSFAKNDMGNFDYALTFKKNLAASFLLYALLIFQQWIQRVSDFCIPVCIPRLYEHIKGKLMQNSYLIISLINAFTWCQTCKWLSQNCCFIKDLMYDCACYSSLIKCINVSFGYSNNITKVSTILVNSCSLVQFIDFFTQV